MKTFKGGPLFCGAIMSDFIAIKIALDEIERCLEDYASGWKNESARQAIIQHIIKIENEAGRNSYISEKLGSLMDWIDRLYSVKKWKPWGSLEEIKHFAFMDCEKIRMYLPQIEAEAHDVH
jgi:hypothetical protein